MGVIVPQPFRGVLKKKCSEKNASNYRRKPMSKCDFNKAAKQSKFAEYYQNTFS